MLAQEAQKLNGCASEGLATQVQASGSLILALVIGFFFNWETTLVCLGCVPFLILGAIFNARMQAGLSSDTSELYKEADMLAGDSIVNYRTVASFGNEEMILDDYKKFLDGPLQRVASKSHQIGIIFGFSQFV